jgi:hypothetical protein
MEENGILAKGEYGNGHSFYALVIFFEMGPQHLIL